MNLFTDIVTPECYDKYFRLHEYFDGRFVVCLNEP